MVWAQARALPTLGRRVAPYVEIARIDHWFKNVFVLPGIGVALYADPGLLGPALLRDAALALLAMGLVASSYYVLNEILDAPFDAIHPLKQDRPIPTGRASVRVAYAECVLLLVAALIVASLVNVRVLGSIAVLWTMGCLYNIPPARTKDKPYLDVLSESLNNPLRMLVGWYCTGITVLPPASLVAAYWMVGAFFMAVKRLAEYRRISDPVRAAAYRRSFAHYDEQRLLVSVVYYAVAFGLFFGIFLVRYRIELILTVPLIAAFIAWYIHLGFLADSPTQTPEKLLRQRGFVLWTFICVGVFVALLFIDLPQIGQIFVPTIRLQGS